MLRFPNASARMLLAVVAGLAVLGSACASEAGSEAQGSDGSTTDGEAVSAEREGWPEEITFAAVPAEQNQRLRESYQVTLDILSGELGVGIEFFQAADYAGVIEAMIAGKVDIAQFGPFSYVIARGNGAEIESAAAMVSEKGEEPGYQSFGITQGDSDEVTSIDDFAGRRVCFVDPSSTSGFLYPSAGLLEAGIDPEEDVEGVFAGGHDASAISVANGDCDAGFAFDSMVETLLIESGDIEEGDLKVVWKSEVIAGSPVAIHTDLPESFRQSVRETLVEKVNVDWAAENGYCDSPDDCSFSDEDIWGYDAVDDAFYDGVRKVCEVTKAAQCEGVGA